MKKFLSILLAAMMVLSMTMAYAADVTINPPTEANGHTYEVLQIFVGDYADGKLSNAKWGANGIGTLNETVSEDVLKALDEVSSKPEAERLAKVLEYVKLDSAPVATITTEGATVPAGYYLIRDKADTLPENHTATLYIVEVADTVTITPKSGTVSFEKKIKDTNDSTGETSDWQDSADYDIGDKVPFQLKGVVASNYDKFTTFYFCFEDTLESSLDYNEDVKVYVDGNEITTGFTVTAAADKHSFKVEFADLKQISAVVAGSVITAEFTATLNENAVYGATGNMNKAKLVYSNNPNSDSKGTTPEDAVICFTYKIDVNKVDEKNEPLTGAEFTLEKLVGTEWVELETVKNDAGTVFTFNGLDDGTYRLTETATPAGYNSIQPITFEVKASHVATDDAMTDFDYTGRTGILTNLTGETASGSLTAIEITFDKATGVGSSNIENKSGAQLPETGGIGTTLFYLFGSIMAAGSALILVVRRRANAEEE